MRIIHFNSQNARALGTVLGMVNAGLFLFACSGPSSGVSVSRRGVEGLRGGVGGSGISETVRETQGDAQQKSIPPGATGKLTDPFPGSLTQAPICTQDEPSPRRIWRLSREQYVNTLVMSFDDTATPTATLQALPIDGGVDGYDNNAKSLFMSGELTTLVRSHAERLSPLVAEKAAQGHSCVQKLPVTDNCLNEVIQALGQKAFRRPLRSDETQRYFAFVKSEAESSSANSAIELYAQFLLRTPQFLYHAELTDAAPESTSSTGLTPYELAERLSFTLTDSPPDEILIGAAAAGKLQTEVQRREQADRLLATPGGKKKLRDFIFQYLGVKSQQGSAPDKETNVVPDFSTGLYGDFVTETTQFIDDIIMQSKPKFSTLFTANHTFANDRLTQFYGLSAASAAGQNFTKTELAGSGRRGVLTQGLFLSTHSSPTATKHRGRANYIYRNMMCLDPGAPPPGATAAGEAILAAGPKKTKRDSYDNFLMKASPSCIACHRRFEPIGLTFETFDHFGRARDKENGFTIDTRSELAGSPPEFASFADAADFSDIFSRSTQAQNCFVRNAFTYTLGRAPHPTRDGCALDRAQTEFGKTGLDFRKLLTDLAVSDALGQRK